MGTTRDKNCAKEEIERRVGRTQTPKGNYEYGKKSQGLGTPLSSPKSNGVVAKEREAMNFNCHGGDWRGEFKEGITYRARRISMGILMGVQIQRGGG